MALIKTRTPTERLSASTPISLKKHSQGIFKLPIFSAGFGLLLSLGAGTAHSALNPQNVYLAESKKSHVYVKKALISGGDRRINDVIVRDIRRGRNPGYERVVLDLEGTRSGEPVAIPRAPYFQISAEPEHERVVVTVWGDPKLRFEAPEVNALFEKSPLIKEIQLLPRVEEDNWTFVIALKEEVSIEAFELKDPVRLIVDLKPEGKAKRVR